jgi:hypothetical protein
VKLILRDAFWPLHKGAEGGAPVSLDLHDMQKRQRPHAPQNFTLAFRVFNNYAAPVFLFAVHECKVFPMVESE